MSLCCSPYVISIKILSWLLSKNLNKDRSFKAQLREYAQIQRGWGWAGGPDPLENTKLPSQHSILGHYRPASETPFPALSGILTLSPFMNLKKQTTKNNNKKQNKNKQTKKALTKMNWTPSNKTWREINLLPRGHSGRLTSCRISKVVSQSTINYSSLNAFLAYIIMFKIDLAIARSLSIG